METAISIFNKTLNMNGLVNSSSVYFETETKLIRFSNHKCNPSNISLFNQENKEIMLVFVNSEMSEFDIQDNVEEVKAHDYLTYNEGDDIEVIKDLVNRFLNK
jgi:hypothetical protein